MRRVFASLLLFAVLSPIAQAEKAPRATLVLSSGETLPVKLALTKKAQKKGFSGVLKNASEKNEGILFAYRETLPRAMWMPNTFFNLDIFFLDADLKVIEVIRNLEHYPHQIITPSVPSTPRIRCRHVLEVPAMSPLSAKIKKGDSLKLAPPMSLQELDALILNLSKTSSSPQGQVKTE